MSLCSRDAAARGVPHAVTPQQLPSAASGGSDVAARRCIWRTVCKDKEEGHHAVAWAVGRPACLGALSEL